MRQTYYLASLLLLLSLLLSPFSTATTFARTDECGAGETDIGYGCETEQERRQREAEQRAAEVASYAAAAGVTLETSPVSTYNNPGVPGGAVAVNGIQMDIAEAKLAIDAISAAYDQMNEGSVDTNTTLKAYTNGTATPGQIVGQTSGVIGNPETVAKAEIEANVGAAAVGAAAVQYGMTYLSSNSNLANLLNDVGLYQSSSVIDVNTAATPADSEFYSADVFFSSAPLSGAEFTPEATPTFTKLSPAQEQMYGVSVTGDDWTDEELKSYAAAILASENSDIAGKIGRGEPLTPEEQAEANSIMAVAINRAAATGRSVTDYFTNDVYSDWETNSQLRIGELENNHLYDHSKVGDYYEDLFTGETVSQTFHSFDLSGFSPIDEATHYYNPRVATDQTQGEFAVEGTQTRLGEHVFSQQYVRDRSAIEYQIKTTGLPDYVTVVDTTSATAEEVTTITGSGDFAPDDTTPSSFTGTDTNERPRILVNREYAAYQESLSGPQVKQNTSCDCVSVSITGEDRPLGVNDSYVEQLDQVMSLVQEQYPELGLYVEVFSGTHTNPNYDPAKGSGVPSGRHANGNGGDVKIYDQSGNRVTDLEIMAAVAQAVGTVNPQSGIGYSEGSNTITHIDFEPTPGNNYHGTWTYGTKTSAGEAVQQAWQQGTQGYSPSANQDVQTNALVTNNVNGQNNNFAADLGYDAGSALGNALCGEFCGNVGGALGQAFGNAIASGGGGRPPRGGGSVSDDDKATTPTEADCIPCPLEEGCENLLYLDYCPDYEGALKQSGAVWLGFSGMLTSITELSDYLVPLFQQESRVVTTTESIVKEVTVIEIPVTVTINAATGEVELTRQDILNELEENKDYYIGSVSERAAIIAPMEETPLIFNDDGDILYSNGIYTPAVKDGKLVDIGAVDYNYIYTVLFIDENGELIETENNASSLPDNLINNLLRAAFTSGTNFNIGQVASVTYTLIDPDKEVKGDEYYEYDIALSSNDVRSVTLPQFTSVNFMQERFADIGYQGEALDLIAIATEVEKESGLIGKFLGFVQDITSGVVNRVFTDPEVADDQITTLPTSSEGELEVLSLSLYTDTDVQCAVGASGFIYSALVSNPEDTTSAYYVTDGRCGDTNIDSMIEESIRHLYNKYRVSDDISDEVLDNITLVSQATHYEPTVSRIALVQEKEDQPAPTEEVPATEEPVNEPAESLTDALPNLTNDITFEVKAIGGDGNVLADWTTADSLNITGNVQLYFRWNGTAYQQCLPFLQDGGNYALTRTDSAMITGNTEAEGYNVTERTGTYRIECGGQRNNEFGVDFREVQVNLQ